MKIAVIGSRGLTVSNLSIIDYADCVIAFWDGTKLFPTTPQSPAVTAPLTRGALKQTNRKIKPVVIGYTDNNRLCFFWALISALNAYSVEYLQNFVNRGVFLFKSGFIENYLPLVHHNQS